MINWQNKTDLITWLEDHAPTRGSERALRSGGEVTLLGSFRPLPGSNSPGFIVTVLSRAGKTYYIAITLDNFRKPRAYLIDYIDWKTYCGGDSEHKLYRGDTHNVAVYNKFNEVFERVG